MTFLVPLMLFGWVPLAIFLFNSFPPHRAALFVVIGGWLLLPTAGYDLPGFPLYSKDTAIALGVILGGRLSGARQSVIFIWQRYDFPIVAWCLSPLITSVSNQLGWYDGLSGTLGHITMWFVPYLAGRLYFTNKDELRDLCLGIIYGGILYALLCLFEIKMSPRLHIMFYGFFQHEWIQHKRYGGWRPIVFMQHGLMVAFWMASCSTVAFWLWRERVTTHLKGISMSFIVGILLLTTILCKSANGWFFLVLGVVCYFKRHNRKVLLLLLLVVPCYLGLRVSGVISAENVEMVAATIFDAERVSSLSYRLSSEDLFIERAVGRPFLGWGGHSRSWPVDPATGEQVQKLAVDSFWIITFSSKGIWGLVSFVIALLMGPWLVLKSMKHNQGQYFVPLDSIVLSLIVTCFAIDCLINAMINPTYIMISGALVGWSSQWRYEGVDTLG